MKISEFILDVFVTSCQNLEIHFYFNATVPVFQRYIYLFEFFNLNFNDYSKFILN